MYMYVDGKGITYSFASAVLDSWIIAVVLFPWDAVRSLHVRDTHKPKQNIT